MYDGTMTLEGALALFHTTEASSQERGSALHFLMEEHWGILKREYSEKKPGNGRLKALIEPETMSSLDALPIVKVHGEELIEDQEIFFTNVFPGNLTRFLDILRNERRTLWEIVEEYPEDPGIIVACIALYKFGLHMPEWRESNVLTDDFAINVGIFLTHDSPHVICMGLRIAVSIVRRWSIDYLRDHRHILELIRKNMRHPDPIVSSLSLRFLAQYDGYFDMDLVRTLLGSDSIRDRSDAVHLLHIACDLYTEIPEDMARPLFRCFGELMANREMNHHQNDIVLPFMRIPDHEEEKVEFLMNHLFDPRCRYQQSLFFIIKNSGRFFPWTTYRDRFWEAFEHQRFRRELLGEIFASFDDMEFYRQLDSLPPDAALEGKIGFLSKRKVQGTVPFLHRVLQDLNNSTGHGINDFFLYKSLRLYTSDEIVSDPDLDAEAKRYILTWCGPDQKRSTYVND